MHATCNVNGPDSVTTSPYPFGKYLMRMRKNLAAKIGGFLLASLIAGTSLPAFAANDCDLDNDHITDATCGGNDKELDNDNVTDARFSGNDKDMDNDNKTDASFGGTDTDLDNDHSTDAAFGGNDTDQDNDHSTDKYNVGAPPHTKK